MGIILLFCPRFAQPEQIGERQAAQAGQGPHGEKITAGNRLEMGRIVLPGSRNLLRGFIHAEAPVLKVQFSVSNFQATHDGVFHCQGFGENTHSFEKVTTPAGRRHQLSNSGRRIQFAEITDPGSRGAAHLAGGFGGSPISHYLEEGKHTHSQL